MGSARELVDGEQCTRDGVVESRSILALAHAKLNLCLRVLGRRSDGYHEIYSTMTSIELADEVLIRPVQSGMNTLEVEGADTGPDLQNLALKAACVFQDLFDRKCREQNASTEHHAAFSNGGARVVGESRGVPKNRGAVGRDGQRKSSVKAHPAETETRACSPALEIRLLKRVPVASGLGGGSADAAAVLHAANVLFGKPFDLDTLASVGRTLGSDVPFCVHGGLATVRGTGETVERASPERIAALARCWFVVAIPDIFLSTAEVYAALSSVRKRSVPDEVPAPLASVVEEFVNDLEPAAESIAPELKKLRGRLSSMLGSSARLTGSGSAVFGVTDSSEHAEEVAKEARRSFPRVIVCRPSPVGVTISPVRDGV